MTRLFHLPTCRCGGSGWMPSGRKCMVNDGLPLPQEQVDAWLERTRRLGFRPPPRSRVDEALRAARAHLPERPKDKRHPVDVITAAEDTLRALDTEITDDAL